MNDTGIPFLEPLGVDDPSSEATGNYLLVRNINDYKVNQLYFFYCQIKFIK